MNAPAEAFRCQSLAKEIAAELRAKYDLKAACLPVNVCLLRSSIMIRAAPWEVLGTRCSWPIGAAACAPQATAAQAATLAPRPPFNARVETVTTKPFFREPFTGGAIGRKIAAASRRDHLPCGPLQAARGLQRSGLC